MNRFLTQAAAIFLASIAAVAAFNVWVDPYRMWNIAGGLSQDLPRPRAVQEGRLLKTRGIERVRPVTVILGNSRAEIGFDPRSAAWPAAFQPVYNAALAGTGVDAIESSLRQAISAGRLKTAVIGLDYIDFLTGDADAPATAPDERPSWQSDVRIAFSLDTLLDSVQTIAEQHDAYAADITPAGFNPLHQYIPIVRLEGYGSVFRQKDEENARAYARMPKSLYFKSTQTSEAWRTLDRILSLARKHGVDLRFVIYPYHAHILEMFHRAGLYPAFEEWKKHLAEVIDQGGVDATRCRLWDFSGYNAYSTEYVPPPSDRTAAVRWYWESGHFKHELGDRVLARMLGDDDTAFGSCLHRDNVDERNLRLRRAHTRYLLDEPKMRDMVDHLFRGATR